jgi:hypothetical protein
MDEFYKDKCWDMLLEELKGIKKSQEDMRIEITAVDKKVSYIYWYAAGLGSIAGLIVAMLKDRILNLFK